MFNHVWVSQIFSKSSIIKQNVNKINLQSLRYFRRPYELGTTKAKLFKVRKERTTNPEEEPDIRRLYAKYNLQMLSLNRYFLEQKKRRDAAKVYECTFESDFIKVSNRIDDWNREVAEKREAREEKKRREEETRILEDIECREKKKDEERLRLNELVRREKEAAKSFIVRENIDEAIEMALNNVIDFNFAIDIDGQQHPGRFDAKLNHKRKEQEQLDQDE